MKAADDREFMATLAKGLAVLGSFGEQRPTMTLSEAAAAASLSRSAARRVLLTLQQLGYVTADGRKFALAPRILELGFAYLSTQSWLDRAEPLMKELSHTLQESCSAAILQGAEIVYVARMPAPHRIMSTTIAVASRAKLKARILADHEQGYSIVDEELEKGLRSIAVPIVTRAGINVGAVNLSAHASRATRKDLRERFLPRLLAVAQQVSRTVVGT